MPSFSRLSQLEAHVAQAPQLALQQVIDRHLSQIDLVDGQLASLSPTSLSSLHLIELLVDHLDLEVD